MANINIMATRLDQRLLHGQATFFVRERRGNIVIVANDAASTDSFQQDLMKVCLSSEIALRFFSIDKTIEVIHNAAPEQKIIMIVGNVTDMHKLITNGVPIKHITMGNIHAAQNRKKYNKFINLSDDELKMLKDLYNNWGVEFTNKGLSTDITDQPLNWPKILKAGDK